jgi:2-keto-4-pentenoate hydratase/2-oxohepta-3-ene-1,7-dioic acid hydratase in catechol pathway
MRLATFTIAGDDAPRAGEVRGDQVVAFAGGTVLDRLAGGDRAPADGEAHALADVRLLAPVPRPRAIFGIGLNYADHAAETGREQPQAPIVFMKLPTSSAPPNDELHVPAVIRRLDYEGELAVVMGAGGEVAGYAIADDVSARDLQGREAQWTRAKGFDASCPWGPWITTADELGGADETPILPVRTWVNGEQRQDGTTRDLIFDVQQVVAFIAETCTFEPGDLILTGTPAGVGMAMDPARFLEPGDVVRIEIEGLGAIEHAIGAPLPAR